jgi:signal transduction histidine kinase/CheY-like chemotaxis protein/HPt (histidine-containing phosphotransfer) domain-containing protein
LIFLCFILGFYQAPAETKKQIKQKNFNTDDKIVIGVLANNGSERCLAQWSSTADYLDLNIPGYNFTIIPLSFEAFSENVEKEMLDFTLTNPSMYIDLKVRYGVSRLVTMENTIFYRDYLKYGAVIFTRAENTEITSLNDIEGQSFAAVDAHSLGGWQIARKAFRDMEIDPFKDFERIHFSGTHEDVVYDVIAGRYDAGTVRTDTLENMEKEGKINLSDIKILNGKEDPKFPFLHSTQLYPEWVIAKAAHVSDDMAHDVALTLMAMSEFNLAALNAGIGGWTVPQDYTIVEDLLKELRISPYEDFGMITIPAIITQYRWFLIGFLIALMIFVIYNIRLRMLSEAVSDALEHSREMEKKANEASQAKSMFVANISHEIRTPMNAIIGLSNLLFKTRLNARQLDYNKKLYSSAKSLLGLINNILDFSKIEAGKMELENRPFTLNEIVYNLSNLLTLKADQHGVELLFDIAYDIPGNLRGDSVKLTQVLINLINNAIKFTERGNIIVRVYSKPFTTNQLRLFFEITDTGIGMTEKQLSKLFSAFTQADASTTRKYGGTGLGLTISKQIIELMGGSISVKSVYGKGSTFSFDIILEYSMLPQNEIIYPHEILQQKILIVDDNPEARKIIRKTLENFGFNVEEADSGMTAIEKIKCEIFSLIILDYKMPEMNGIETAQIIRQIETDNDHLTPKIMMISAYGKEEIKKEAELSGIAQFLDKPVNPSLLYNSIMEIQGYTGFDKSSYENRITEDVNRKNLSLYGTRVLLVEDNEINQQVASEILTGEGFEITVADNGVDALERIKNSTKEEFDVILMDIQMPVMDGREATRRIRALGGYWKQIPIIALTALSFEEENKKNLDCGMNDRVSKPIEVDQIIEVLSHYIQPKTASVINEMSAEFKALDTSIKIEGIQVKEGLTRLMGNEKLYLDLLKSFTEKNLQTPSTLRKALKNNDFSTSMRIVHTIKGISANLGINRLAGCAARLEKAYQNEINDAEGFKAFEEQLSATLKAIADYFEKDTLNPVTVTDSENNADVLSEELVQLLKEVKDFKTDAIKLAERLNKKLPKNLKPDFSVILSMINDLQYEEAEKAIDHFSSLYHFKTGED